MDYVHLTHRVTCSYTCTYEILILYYFTIKSSLISINSFKITFNWLIVSRAEAFLGLFPMKGFIFRSMSKELWGTFIVPDQNWNDRRLLRWIEPRESERERERERERESKLSYENTAVWTKVINLFSLMSYWINKEWWCIAISYYVLQITDLGCYQIFLKGF